MKANFVVTLLFFSLTVLATASGPPTAVTGSGTGVSSSSATLNGSVIPNGLSTTAYFQWGQTISYGNTVPQPAFSCGSGTTKIGISAQLPYTGPALTPNTTYHFRLVGVNSDGTIYGNDTNFTTLPLVPTVSTSPATFTNFSSAGLAGVVNPNGAATTAYYQWGLTTAYGSNTPSINIGSENNNVNVPFTLTGLNPNTTYHYQLWATNSGGSNNGSDMAFTTGEPPPPVFLPIIYSGGIVYLTCSNTLSGTNYELQYSDDLINWINRSEEIASTNTVIFDDIPGQDLHRFYRLETIP
jgi:hypothetical protein